MGRHEDIEKAGLSDVVRLSDHRSQGGLASLSQIERHWDVARAGRLLPDRSDIDPRSMTGALEHAFILERLATGLARFRLAGSHINDLVGLEVRGMPISSIFTPDGRRLLADALQAVFDEPAVVRLLLESPSEFGRPHMTGEVLLLPLRSDLGDVTRVLGGLAMTGETGRRPRRLSITGQTRKTLTGYAKPVEAKPGSQTTATLRLSTQSRTCHLELVVDNT